MMSWKNSVAKICVLSRNGDRDHVKSSGTGFLVSHDLLLSAWHVVAKSDNQPWNQNEVEISAIFDFPDSRLLRKHPTVLSIVDHSVKEDWVLLRCEVPPSDVQPLSLVGGFSEEGTPWSSCGFPEATNEQLLFLNGTITESNGKFEGARMLQLFSPQVAAAKGLLARGISGAPVVVRRAAPGAQDNAEEVTIGMLQRQHTDMGEALAGSLFASPCYVFLKNAHLPDYDAKRLLAIRWLKRLFVRLAWALLTPLKQYSLYIFAVITFFLLPLLVLYWPEEWVVRNYLPEDALESVPSNGDNPPPSFAGVQNEFEQARLLLDDWTRWITQGAESETEKKSTKYLVATFSFTTWYHAFDREINVYVHDSTSHPLQIVSAAAFLVDNSHYSHHSIAYRRYRQQLIFIDRGRMTTDLAIRPSHIYVQPPNKNECLLLLLKVKDKARNTTDELPADPNDYCVTLTIPRKIEKGKKNAIP